MGNIKVLDCTLRDGGRLFNCEFSDRMITDLIKRLEEASIEIIEVGFIRDNSIVNYKGNSTFFTDTCQINRFIPSEGTNSPIYTVFIDYGLYDFCNLKAAPEQSVDGIRFGFTKRNYAENKNEIVDIMKLIKKLGYKLFVQAVNTPGYDKNEFLELIGICNKIGVYSFGIVDTYGAMYPDDLKRYFKIANQHLNKEICIDFHSHNNYQLSFALSLEFIKLSNASGRNTIIDATLNGMGKGAGNLNEELLINYLNRFENHFYDFDGILDIIDDYLKEIKNNSSWGYTVPAMLSGIYRAHPNNMLYLTDKHDMSSRGIEAILKMMTPEERQRYNYEKLDFYSEKYRTTKVDDYGVMRKLRGVFSDKDILLIMPGKTIVSEKEKVDKVVTEYKPIIISVNFIYESEKEIWSFFGSGERYDNNKRKINSEKTIITSNIMTKKRKGAVVDYESLVFRGNSQFDNSAIMCIRMLLKCKANRIFLAGFDGYNDRKGDYFESTMFQSDLFLGRGSIVNNDIQQLMKQVCEEAKGKTLIEFVTTSKFHC